MTVAQDIERRTLRQCPRCSCGLLPTSPICEYCGAVLSHIAALGDEVSGIVCAECGEQNDPTALACRACQKRLLHSCPKCAASVGADAAWCVACGLLRSSFFEECVRQDTTARTTSTQRLRRFAVIDNILVVAVIAIFIGLAWWQQLRRDAWEWKAWLAITVWWVVMWALWSTDAWCRMRLVDAGSLSTVCAPARSSPSRYSSRLSGSERTPCTCRRL